MWTWLTHAADRVRTLFGARALDRDFEQELDAHLALLAHDYERRGMRPDEARRAARLRLGGVETLKDQHRDTRGLPAIDTIRQDLRYALRTLRRDPAFALFATLIVGLGIGASTTVFSVVHAVILRPLPFSDPDRLVWIQNDLGEGLSSQTTQAGQLVEMEKQNQSFAALAGYTPFFRPGDMKLTGQGEPERLTAVPVSQQFFPLLGVQPQLGRAFTPEECIAASYYRPTLALVTHELWTRRFAADPAIVGRQITLNDVGVTVVGVLPASFDFSAVFAPGTRVDLFVPFPLVEHTHRRGNMIAMLGRMKPGVTVDQARAEINVLAGRIRQEHRDWNTFTPLVTPLDARVSGRFRHALFVLAAGVSVVMLIVCANRSNLLLSRTATRRTEMAVRAALGAGRGRLIRQMLTESLMLSGGGAVVGIALAVAGTRLVSGLDAFSIPLLGRVQLDLTAAAFTLAVSAITGIVFGVLPAMQVRHLAVNDALKDSSRGSTAGRTHAWMRRGLVVAEIALACVLLFSAGLLVRSFIRVLDVDLGCQPSRAAALRLDPHARRPTQAARNAYYDEALQRVRALPGVESAGLTDVLPYGANRSWSAGAKERSYSKENPPPETFVRIVSDGYFRAMGIALKAGRDFTAHDLPDTTRVIIINETLARALWPGQDPIGRTVKYVDPERQVIGVVADVRHLALEESGGPEMYLPIRQTEDYSVVDLVVRSALPPAAMAAMVRAALRPIEPTMPANEFRTLQELVDQMVSPRRFLVLLLSGFAAFALVLASLGVYAVISHAVTQQTSEFGIRMALGASRGAVQRGVMLQTLGLVAAGVLIGLVSAAMLGRMLGSLLFGVTATDPITFAGMLIVLVLVAALAGYLPALRASRIDPMVALRAE